MKISDPNANQVLNENELLLTELPLKHAHVLELGCGTAEKTRAIAKAGNVAAIVALEVDAIQHAKNLTLPDLTNVSFRRGAAEAIPEADDTFDIALMFKSLHHVPMDSMDLAFQEIRRVLKPGGFVWISEPVYTGPFNDIVRLFHDEKIVREAAFAATCRAVNNELFTLEKQLFFSMRRQFQDFEQFERQVLHVTHTQHQLTPETLNEVRRRFEEHLTEAGACFFTPLRIDILKTIK